MKKNFVILMVLLFTSFIIGAATAEVAVTSEGWENLISYIITFFGSSFGLLIMGIIYSILKKLNLENNRFAVELADEIIQQAIKATEKWANKQDKKVPGKDKFSKAVEFARELSKNEGVKQLIDAGDDYLEAKIESKLKDEDIIWDAYTEKK